ncbi:putative ankyrin repeat protein [Paramyrothecium foliicola]|nr:putative ankyrin repeat protein [Paramyrothecium foliicola]
MGAKADCEAEMPKVPIRVDRVSGHDIIYVPISALPNQGQSPRSVTGRAYTRWDWRVDEQALVRGCYNAADPEDTMAAPFIPHRDLGLDDDRYEDLSSQQPVMDGFSVLSLTSLCSSISHRALSSIEEVDGIVEATSHEGLASLLGMLHGLNRGALQLEAALNSSSTISTRAQSDLNQSLAACDGTMAIVNKQLMRIEPVHSIAVANKEFLAPKYDFLASHIQLFTYFQEVLRKRRKEDQDASLDLEGVGILLEAENTVQYVTEVVRSPSDTNLSSAEDQLEAPPPYESSSADPPPQAEQSTTPTSPKCGSTSKFSWAQPFKALAASLRPKPDPMVSALCQATLRGDERQITGLIEQGANVNGRDEEGRSPLQCAVQGDQETVAQLLISHGADWKGSTWMGTPPLFQAAAAGSTRVARVLVKKGARVDEASLSGQPYFADVVAAGNVEGIQFLLSQGVNPHSYSISGRPVLATAIRKGYVEVVKLLLDYGADPCGSDISGGSMLAMACEKEDTTIAEMLLSYGAKPNSRTPGGITVLVDAISKRRFTWAKKLLESGADANAKDWSSQCVLVSVIRDKKLDMAEKVDMARALLEHGASPNVSDNTWSKPLIAHTMEMGNAELFALLLQHGAKTKMTMGGGETLLLYALDRGDRAAVKMLLEHGTSAKTKDKKGRTPLMEAMLKHDEELVRLLIQHGADPKVASVVAPADLAKALGRPELLQGLGMNEEAAVMRAELKRQDSRLRATPLEVEGTT